MVLKRLEKIMTKRGLRAEDLAATAMVSVTTVRTARRGGDIHINTVKRIAQALGLTEKELH